MCDFCVLKGFILKRWTFSKYYLPLKLAKRPGATLGQGPVACSWDAPRLLQLHKRMQRAFNWLQCIPIGGGIWRSWKHRIRLCRRLFKGNVSVHSHWITENFTPGSKYSPYCRLILQWYLHYSSTQKHQIILVNYTTLIGLNCVQCFCIFPLRFGETNLFLEFRMAEETTLPRIPSYRLGLHRVLCLTNPVISSQALWLDVGVAVREVYTERQTAVWNGMKPIDGTLFKTGIERVLS